VGCRAALRDRGGPGLVSRRVISRRRLIPSGGPFETVAGYSRAVVEGDTCEVAGTTDAGPDGESLHPGDAGAQARAALAIVGDALHVAGFSLDDVVRTRLYLVDRADVDAVLAVHGELFRDIRPAATLVLVAGLIRPSLRVEVEVTARRA
jgi:enamine deaminase RidA (YjgF/YER057c/UK114 family)